ncbi:MAG: UDP-N-acetylglucosamine 2-epimerase [Ignavibacteria bacterium GWA2_55_11]|nr:MAG: UDP-N-acetylglucosamine 2-epimerase [Ignavibacteria bacterium GWA2_55_11]OGU46782.1 MAG: UDP-N-acetylglucosamine 2-epimerase [Ignavibacteria bacterium GWC2_56_12]OGU63665.1 MAG: UDP-N-acetylglucosamine 2-epimerase [Ignavibacteria bacterium RIFCSPHIGHO2_02_FULL_56_12]OGU69750.1 MAG: UDP-N-acetylglucosamine 2-epimerase [Ignavibacteria bacterium RIFCSPLOWO2_02_FULL_55_14]OGU75900.1 MAG: UDP-N-acetylglucosamine 2-epimerase [Ignavibacteria bacterium RIFCSPLOWO2_12_FULL_56_21]HAV23288.1 UDP-
MKRLLFIAGTRPEIIKLAPILLQARVKHTDGLNITLCLTGQHKNLADQAVETFGITPDVNLAIMQEDQTITDVVRRVFELLPAVIDKRRPDVLVVQGDTTTAVAAALCAFSMRIAVAHVEAGLRSFNLDEPYPEEFNRRVISTCARVNFCPTPGAKENLLHEGIVGAGIHVTGNTIVDALKHIDGTFDLNNVREVHPAIRTPFVLITAHRRESFGAGIRDICSAIKECARTVAEAQFVYPVHPNPHIKEPAEEVLKGVPNVLLTPPLTYMQFLTLMKNCKFLLTDSGGLQEEAPSFGKYCIVMRNVTERRESVDKGISELVGTSVDRIVASVQHQWTHPTRVDPSDNPYGDGHASERILDILRRG